MKAVNGKELSGMQLDEALKVHNATRAREDNPSLTKDYYSGKNPQRMYGADLVNFWVNDAERDKDGLVIRDYRVAIKREALL